jgi:hypothetical protein
MHCESSIDQEDQAFSPTHGLAPPPPLTPFSVSELGRRQTWGARRENGGGVGEEPNHTTARSLVLCISFNTLTGTES